MLTLTLFINKNGAITYQSDNKYIRVIGEFLTCDAISMPDFIRALLIADEKETVTMDSCLVETKDSFFIIKHLYCRDFPIVNISKKRMLQILDIWEDFLVQKNPTQWIFFKEEEFESCEQENNSHLVDNKNKQKEIE